MHTHPQTQTTFSVGGFSEKNTQSENLCNSWKCEGS